MFTPTVSVRLRGGKSSDEGLVELYYKNTWRTVCDSYRYWTRDKNDKVVCRMLGFVHSYHTIRRAKWHYGNQSEQSWFGQIRCEGNEMNLVNCRWNNADSLNCNYIGLICSNSSGKTNCHHSEMSVKSFLFCPIKTKYHQILLLRDHRLEYHPSFVCKSTYFYLYCTVRSVIDMSQFTEMTLTCIH